MILSRPNIHNLVFILVYCIFVIPIHVLAAGLSNNGIKRLRTSSCDKDLFNGVNYSVLNENGLKTKMRLRFAPIKLSSKQEIKFSKFKDDFEKKYGKQEVSSYYGLLRCRFYFGSYDLGELPIAADVVEDLLQRCPLKIIENIALAPPPIPDCAPATGQCFQRPQPPTRHPYDKIPCIRKVF
jgi:hypothetical protein